jgi:GMP synthase (glutamine-hydrolysing)
MISRSALAIRHIHFEDLGLFAGPLKEAGYAIRYVDAGLDDLTSLAPLDDDLLVLLGGPIGAYDESRYPFVTDEIELLQQRLAADRPTLGICLGAQLIARALGAGVRPMGRKEIGWSPLTLSTEGMGGPLRHLTGRSVLHWHGDTFSIPAGCDRLGSTETCRNQAFARGRNVLALQFHAEADLMESWLIGHACELEMALIDPATLRSDSATCRPLLREAAWNMMHDWLASLSYAAPPLEPRTAAERASPCLRLSSRTTSAATPPPDAGRTRGQPCRRTAADCRFCKV